MAKDLEFARANVECYLTRGYQATKGCLRFWRHESPQVSLSRRPKSAFEGMLPKLVYTRAAFL
jgi:hypothetical protein